MAWLPPGVNKTSNNNRFPRQVKSPSSPTLQILGLETAKCMVRLVALYKSLSDIEFLKLRKGLIKSPGVSALNSNDETYLLGLAYREMLENLDQAAHIVSRLAKKCVDGELNRFDIAYHNMKQGIIDMRNLDFNSKDVVKIIEQMEKYACSTSSLYASLVDLEEMEISDKKLKRGKKNRNPHIDHLNEEISSQRKQVLHFRKISLWDQTFDKIVGLMARIVCVVFARICTIFEPYLPSLCSTTKSRHSNRHDHNLSPKPPEFKGSGFRLSAITKTDKFITKKENIVENMKQSLIQLAPENTVGAAGLSLRYANVIIMAEAYFYSTTMISKNARECMFEMLPTNLKQTLRGKLKCHWFKEAEVREGQQRLTEEWKLELEEIFGWLAPMAHDTLRWQQERNLEQRNLDAKPNVLLLQTLHFSDLEKTEVAIVEILVGLSCIYRYENQRRKAGIDHT